MKVMSSFFWASLFFSNLLFGQQSPPPGAIAVTSSSFNSILSIGSGEVYYVPANTSVTVNHNNQNLTITPGGTLLIMPNAYLNLSFGTGGNITIQGEVHIYNSGTLYISPAHDFQFNTATSTMKLDSFAALSICDFGHDITFNQGSIQMDLSSSITFADYHNFVSNAANVISYNGPGTASIGHGNALILTTGSDYMNYTNLNNLTSSITASNHIDFVNDNYENNNNAGAANYVGPRAYASHLPERLQWPGLLTGCNAASVYQRNNSVLPVKLISFQVILKSSDVLVQWATAQENNSKSFEIQKSSDGLHWKTIGNVTAAGESSVFRDYSFRDKNVSGTTLYYRLLQSDRDGGFDYSEVRIIKLYSSSADIKIFADDTKNITTSFLHSLNEAVSIQVHSMSGIMITKKAVSQPTGIISISADSFPPGAYIVSVTGENGLITAKNIIIR